MDKQTRLKLKGQAHSLKPTAIIGNNGLTESVHKEIDCALKAHELIKIRVNAEDKAQRTEITQEICKHHQAELIDEIGHVISVYRESKEKE